MIFRIAASADLAAVTAIYDAVTAAEAAAPTGVGWLPGVYPTAATAQAALDRGDLFVAVDDKGAVLATAIINKIQVDVYADAPWSCAVPDDQVMVLHTLAVAPDTAGAGVGRAFVDFYERYADAQGCPVLRMDTNANNRRARRLYARLGYSEVTIVPTTFNGIAGVDLVLLEKNL